MSGIGVFCWTQFSIWQLEDLSLDARRWQRRPFWRSTTNLKSSSKTGAAQGPRGWSVVGDLRDGGKIGVTKEIADASLIVLKIFFGSAMVFVWRTSSSVCSTAIRTGILKQTSTVINCFSFTPWLKNRFTFPTTRIWPIDLYVCIYIYIQSYIPRTHLTCFFGGWPAPFYGSNLPKYGSCGF